MMPAGFGREESMSFSSMYVGATGVKAHGTRMQVVANNLANVNTLGYKKGEALFGDLMSKQMASGGGQYEGGANFSSQIGLGVGVSEVRNIFKEGGLTSTRTVTDLAITGHGFFGVRDPGGTGAGGGGASHYTRAGAFRFNKEGYMVDPHGFRLQGYEVNRDTGDVSGSVSDIQLPYDDVTIDGETVRVVRSDPKATTSIDMITNLDAKATDHYTNESNPFFAMLNAYDATLSNASSPFGTDLPAYSSSLQVYDANGVGHKTTIYFDPVSSNQISNATPGHTYWEYVVAIPADSDASSAYGTSSAGLVGAGVMVFNGNGEFVNQASYSIDGGSKVLSNWGAATFSADGNPQFQATFGSNGGATGGAQTISFDFGLSSTSQSWTGTGTAGSVGRNADNLLEMNNLRRDARITTSFDSGSATLYGSQDGYTRGYLQNISVNREGVLSGLFSNGQIEELYHVGMYRFNSEWGLRRDGNNNFIATDASGKALVGRANEGGRGTMQQNTLENSNVDMAEEFANMILTQRGYQANTKVITTSDSILNTTISIKR